MVERFCYFARVLLLENFASVKFRKNKTLAKVSEFTVVFFIAHATLLVLSLYLIIFMISTIFCDFFGKCQLCDRRTVKAHKIKVDPLSCVIIISNPQYRVSVSK